MQNLTEIGSPILRRQTNTQTNKQRNSFVLHTDHDLKKLKSRTRIFRCGCVFWALDDDQLGFWVISCAFIYIFHKFGTMMDNQQLKVIHWSL